MSQTAPRDIRAGLAATPRASLAPGSASTPAIANAHATTAEPPMQAPRRRSRWLVWISIFGPGIISAAAGNDAGGIFTFSKAGATYGFSLLWTLVIVTVGLIVVQEMCGRMATVTGKGLAALIRENFGVRVTFFAMIVLVIANFAITVSEFAGIAAVGEMFLGPRARLIIVPIAMILVWLLVSQGSYQKVERVFLIASLIFSTYIITALKIGVPWGQMFHAAFIPNIQGERWDAAMVGMAVALIGTTISPYMQFYQQAAVRDKGIRIKDYALAKWDTILGCTLSSIVAAFILITCAQTIHGHSDVRFDDVKDVALSLRPLAGSYAEVLFAFGLLNASLMAAVVVPLSTSYAVTEALGWESGLGRRVRELPLFYGTYGALIILSGCLIMVLPAHSNLINVIINAQQINCGLLPVELVLILLLINRRRLMGKYRNGFWMNVVGWSVTIIAGGLSILNLVLGG